MTNMEDESAIMDVDENYTNSTGKTLTQRLFSKIGQGSLRGAIFNLCCIAIGAGK